MHFYCPQRLRKSIGQRRVLSGGQGREQHRINLMGFGLEENTIGMQHLLSFHLITKQVAIKWDRIYILELSRHIHTELLLFLKHHSFSVFSDFLASPPKQKHQNKKIAIQYITIYLQLPLYHPAYTIIYLNYV